MSKLLIYGGYCWRVKAGTLILRSRKQEFPPSGGWASYSAGGWNLSAGAGAGNNYWGWKANVINPWKGLGLGYGRTYYGNAPVPDGSAISQTVGNGTVYWKGGSFTLQNDVGIYGDKHDRGRTNGFELNIGDFSFGNTIYTNDGEADSKVFDEKNPVDLDARAPLFGRNSHDDLGAWKIGKVFSAPTWIGIRSGNRIDRIGTSIPFFQNLFQNGIHTWFGKQNYYLDYSSFHRYMFMSSGYYNPYTLWGY